MKKPSPTIKQPSPTIKEPSPTFEQPSPTIRQPSQTRKKSSSRNHRQLSRNHRQLSKVKKLLEILFPWKRQNRQTNNHIILHDCCRPYHKSVRCSLTAPTNCLQKHNVGFRKHQHSNHSPFCSLENRKAFFLRPSATLKKINMNDFALLLFDITLYNLFYHFFVLNHFPSINKT